MAWTELTRRRYERKSDGYSSDVTDMEWAVIAPFLPDRNRLLLDLQRRGLTHAPDLGIGDGALGFWNALREVFGATKEQRCWFHKTGNVLNAMPKSVQDKAKGHLHDIWQAETRVAANVAFDYFVATYGVKYDKAVAKLTKDRDVLLAFYDFPAEHSHDRSQAFSQCSLSGGADDDIIRCARQGVKLRRRLSRLSYAGWLPHDRGFVLGQPLSGDEHRCIGIGSQCFPRVPHRVPPPALHIG